MLKIKRVVAASLFVIIPMAMLAQNNTNSPYTRYGFGELADRSFGAGRSMGGIGYGMRSNKQINPLNPASYTSMDSLTFLFDVGVAGQVSWFNDGTNKQRQINGNIEYIALQFPVHRRIGVSAGILPYSYVGYDYGTDGIQEERIDYRNRYTGKGGLNELYGGVSMEIWKKRLSVGANIGYLFGNIDHSMSITPYSSAQTYVSSRTQRIQVRDIRLNFGTQYTHPISASENIVFGIAYSPAKKLNVSSYNVEVLSAISGGTVETAADTIKNQLFDIPHSVGAGVSYVKQNKLTLAVDFLFENWGQARFFDNKDLLKNRVRVATGTEFIPNYMNRSFFSRIRYRTGIHYSNSYLKIRDSGYNEYGASIGAGLPLIDNRSLVNISFEYVKIKPETRILIDEQYFRFTVNYTFNEMWFRKFKVN
ncbi:MAG: hypothetical protein LBH90_07800 [Tannerella sp.]|jgi:hypothetical protein|nr:hypothetical protein [Tannerella sp.]